MMNNLPRLLSCSMVPSWWFLAAAYSFLKNGMVTSFSLLGLFKKWNIYIVPLQI
jgi:hypothetical protein